MIVYSMHVYTFFKKKFRIKSEWTLNVNYTWDIYQLYIFHFLNLVSSLEYNDVQFTISGYFDYK